MFFLRGLCTPSAKFEATNYESFEDEVAEVKAQTVLLETDDREFQYINNPLLTNILHRLDKFDPKGKVLSSQTQNSPDDADCIIAPR